MQASLIVLSLVVLVAVNAAPAEKSFLDTAKDELKKAEDAVAATCKKVTGKTDAAAKKSLDALKTKLAAGKAELAKLGKDTSAKAKAASEKITAELKDIYKKITSIKL